MSQTKIVLSAKELEMVNDSEWILTKQRIIQQVYVLLESVVADIDALVLPKWESLTNQSALLPRIFKGENYLGLPYVTLDHPRLFDTENILTVRTMFWWGHFVSVTLHAGGIYKDPVFERMQRLPNIRKEELHICLHENQWHHYFEPDNYTLLGELPEKSVAEIMKDRNFIKLAYKTSLNQFNDLPGILYGQYAKFAEILV
jgi:hypothetical protein